MFLHFTIFLIDTAFTYPSLAKLSEKTRTNNNIIEAMKPSVCVAAILVFLFCVPVFTSARHVRRLQTHHSQHHDSQPSTREGVVSEPSSYWERSKPMMKRKGADTLQIAGSSLPDCSHACGSCTPCRLVIVSFVCASQEEAETCPMAYKCMCNNKSYPVP